DKLKQLTEWRLVGWAAHLRNNIEAFAAKLKQDGIAADGPTPGSRKRPDGKELHWQTLNLKDDANGLLPFFIQWGSGLVLPNPDKKPSETSPPPPAPPPPACHPLPFEPAPPNPAPLAVLTAKLRLDAILIKGATAQLRATVKGLKDSLSLTS